MSDLEHVERETACRLAVLGMVLLAGCGGGRLVPLDPTTGGDARRPLAQKAAGALTISVQPNAWQSKPSDLTSASLPMRVVLRNGSTEPVSLRPQDQIVEDDRGGRGRALPAEEVTRQLAEKPREFRRPTLSLGASGPGPSTYKFGLGVQREPPPELTDILRLAFPEDPIPPGAAREGFLYFPKPLSGWRRLTVLLTWTGGGFAQESLAFDFTASSWP